MRWAQFGVHSGTDVVKYFTLGDEPRFETLLFAAPIPLKQPAEMSCKFAKCRINETHNFEKYRSPEKASRLNRIMAGHIPEQARFSLNPMLSERDFNWRF